MNAKTFVVRIVKPTSRPALPETTFVSSPRKRNPFLSKTLNIMTGSAVGFFAGISTYLMLRLIGADFGGAESSLIIGLPSILGTLTSLVIF